MTADHFKDGAQLAAQIMTGQKTGTVSRIDRMAGKIHKLFPSTEILAPGFFWILPAILAILLDQLFVFMRSIFSLKKNPRIFCTLTCLVILYIFFRPTVANWCVIFPNTPPAGNIVRRLKSHQMSRTESFP
jgi:hypothetical protein